MTDTDPIDPDGLLRETRWLHALADGLVHDEHAAEDVVQSTFLQALTHPPRDTGALRGWLAQVARRFAYRAGDRARWVRRWERDAARPEAQPSAADLVGRASVHRRLVEAVLALEEPNRNTILLRYFEDVPPREIAKRQGVPVATVRSRIRRALEQLRESLDRSSGGRDAWLSLLAIPATPIAAAGAAAGATAVAAKSKLAIAAAVVLLVAGGFAWNAMRSSEPKEKRGPAPPRSRGSNEMAAVAGAARNDAAAKPASSPIRPRRFDDIAGGPRENRMFGVVFDADTGNPLANAEVTVARKEKNSDPVRMTTGQDGRFDLPMPGSWWDPRVDQLRITAPDHVPWASDDPWSGGARSASRPGGRDVEFGVIEIERGAVVSGRIVTTDGRPVAGATLLLKKGGLALEICSGLSPVGVSGQDGAFTLPDRLATNAFHSSIREVYLVALHEHGVDWTYVNVVKGAERVAVEIVARRGFAARVEVVDADRRPLKDAVVLAFPRFTPLGWYGATHRVPVKPGKFAPGSAAGALGRRLVQKTDAAGVASFTGLPEGRLDNEFDRLGENAYAFFAYADGFETGNATLSAPFAPGRMTIVLETHRERAVTGTVKDGQGSAVAGASVELEGGAKATTNALGEYRLAVGSAGIGEWAAVTATAPGRAYGAHRVWIAIGQPDPRVDFVLEPAVPVIGRVVDEVGKPVAKVHVQLRRDPGGGGFVPGESRGVTGDDGRFSFPLADAGQWELVVQPAFVNAEEWEYETPRARAVFGGQSVEVILRKRVAGKATVVVEIVDASTGAAVDAAGVATMPANTTQGDYLEMRGFMFAVSRGRATGEALAPGSWRLVVAAIGYARHEQEFIVGSDDQEVRLRAALERPGVVIAKVILDELPARARPDEVTIFTPECRWLTEPGRAASKTSRGCGTASEANQWTCRFEDVMPGAPLRLWIQAERGVTDEQLVKLGSGETRTIELRPRASGRARFMTAGKLAGAVRLQVGDGSGVWYPVTEKAVDPAAVWTHEVERPAGTFR